MEDIKLKRKLYTSGGGAMTVYSAVYEGDKCYAVVHATSGYTVVFDHEIRVWKAMKRLIRRKGYYLNYDNTAGRKRFRFASKTAGESRIDLSRFLWTSYNKQPLTSLEGRVYLKECDNGNVCDLRRRNLCVPSESIENRRDLTIRVISNPGKENEEWIEITFGREEPFVEYVPYTPALWTMLMNPRYMRLDVNEGRRGAADVDGYAVRSNLGKFVAIYKKYFRLYEGRRDAVERFIADYQKLAMLEEKNDSAHVNSYRHEHTFDNLMFMDRRTNKAMSDYIKWLADGYEAYTAVNERDEILLEFITPFRDAPLYIKFETPEDYADFQRVYIFGTKLSRKLQMIIYPTEDGLKHQLTPIGMRMAGIVSRDTANERKLDFWTDRQHTDKLLSLPDEAFTVYRKESLNRWLNHLVKDVTVPEGLEKGEPVFFPIAGGGFGKLELIKKGRRKDME